MCLCEQGGRRWTTLDDAISTARGCLSCHVIRLFQPAIGAPWAGIVDACQLNFEKRQLSRKLETTAILQRVPYEEKCHDFKFEIAGSIFG